MQLKTCQSGEAATFCLTLIASTVMKCLSLAFSCLQVKHGQS